MKKLLSFLVFFFFIILNGCEFSLDPADHNLPTMEQLMPTIKDVALKYEPNLPNWLLKKMETTLIKEKLFFYKHANKIYLNREKTEGHIALYSKLYKYTKENHPEDYKRICKQYGFSTLSQRYFEALSIYQKK